MTLLYFAPVRWDSYAQRSHYFSRHFLHESGHRVIWVDPYPTRLLAWRDARRAGRPDLVTPRPANLTVITLSAPPIEPLPGGQWLNRHFLWNRLRKRLEPLLGDDRLGIGIGRPSAVALAALNSLRPEWSVYDAMDDFPEFYRGWSRQTAEALERAIAGGVDVILTASSSLWNKFSSLGPKRVMLRNAFEMASLPPAGGPSGGQPVLGYIGCVSDWFDWSVVCALARAVPHARVSIVGPRTVTPPGLPANIALLPACSHEEAVGHLQRFSVGLIPFKRTRLTDAVDPIEYYAYRAMGLPVLTTRFGDMIDHGRAPGTHFLDGAEGLAGAVTRALTDRADPLAVDRFRTEHDWQRRFADAGLFERILPS